MITHIEIDGFKTFDKFSLNLRPFSAVVGPNASGKSNFFDALKFIALLSQTDIRSAMQELRGEPLELFRRTLNYTARHMSFAVEVLLNPSGADAFGTKYNVKSQRLRYELGLEMRMDSRGSPQGIYVSHESCTGISRKEEPAKFLNGSAVIYSSRKTPFMKMIVENGRASAIELRQDGPTDSGSSRRGRPLVLSAAEASRTALSTINTTEFPHLYALRDLLGSMRFLEINPAAARAPNDRFETKNLKPDASNLSAVLAHLQDDSATESRPEGAINDISVDLATLIPTVRKVEVLRDSNAKDYSFEVKTSEGLSFSSRVISDGTLRVLALLTILNDPSRKGILCFEEPENGVHEGRIPSLINLLRLAADLQDADRNPFFQVLINTHSPAVLQALQPSEIIASDTIVEIDPASEHRQSKTRMRTGILDELDVDPERHLTRTEVLRLLKREAGDA